MSNETPEQRIERLEKSVSDLNKSNLQLIEFIKRIDLNGLTAFHTVFKECLDLNCVSSSIIKVLASGPLVNDESSRKNLLDIVARMEMRSDIIETHLDSLADHIKKMQPPPADLPAPPAPPA